MNDKPMTVDALQSKVKRLTDDFAAATHLLADRDAQIERLKAELATLRASAASVQADQRAEIDAANAVIDELIACDDIRNTWEMKRMRGKEPSLSDLSCERRNRIAWEAARALRKGTTCC